jgi:diadenosine tetraphosphate (Ap4A) HIT family hydrolase
MFVLHERLEADTLFVTDWPLCRVLLLNDSNYPWLVLVPRRHGITEVHELDASDRQILVEEIAQASHKLQNLTGARKMNVAALGNMVPQLHVHVIARFDTDPAWPKPVWGQVPAASYTADAQAEMVAKLKKALG